MSQKLVLIVIVLSLCVGPAGGGAEWGQEPGGGRHEERIRTPDDGGLYIFFTISHLRSDVDPDSHPFCLLGPDPHTFCLLNPYPDSVCGTR